MPNPCDHRGDAINGQNHVTDWNDDEWIHLFEHRLSMRRYWPSAQNYWAFGETVAQEVGKRSPTDETGRSQPTVKPPTRSPEDRFWWRLERWLRDVRFVKRIGMFNLSRLAQ